MGRTPYSLVWIGTADRLPLLALAIVPTLIALSACGGKPKPKDTNPLADCDAGMCNSSDTLYLASTLAFAASDGGRSPGFHLKGADTGACPSSNLMDPTGTHEVDNQVANVIPILENAIGSAFPTLLQNSVNAGGISLLLEIVGNPATDSKVDLVVHHGTGAPIPQDDGTPLADQTIQLAAEPPLGICVNATIANGSLTCGPFDLLVPVVVFGLTYDATFLGTYITMTLPTDGSDSQVVLGGAMSVANITAIGAEAGPQAGENLAGVITNVIPGLADVADPMTSKCDEISGTLLVNARIAFAMAP